MKFEHKSYGIEFTVKCKSEDAQNVIHFLQNLSPLEGKTMEGVKYEISRVSKEGKKNK